MSDIDFPAEHYERTWPNRYKPEDLNDTGRRGLGLPALRWFAAAVSLCCFAPRRACCQAGPTGAGFGGVGGRPRILLLALAVLAVPAGMGAAALTLASHRVDHPL